jgi:hypothetical protein
MRFRPCWKAFVFSLKWGMKHKAMVEFRNYRRHLPLARRETRNHLGQTSFFQGRSLLHSRRPRAPFDRGKVILVLGR